MQYLKDDVKYNIVHAALAEFKEKGYQDSSMRIIARNANIVMGNIYRYFENKEALYNYIVGPVYNQIQCIAEKAEAEIVALKGPLEDEQALIMIKHMCDQFLETLSGRGTELLILMDKSQGSKYENTRAELIFQIDHILGLRMLQEAVTENANIKDTFILHVVATSFVEGVCVILRSCSDHNRKEVLISQFANIVLCQISQRI